MKPGTYPFRDNRRAADDEKKCFFTKITAKRQEFETFHETVSPDETKRESIFSFMSF